MNISGDLFTILSIDNSEPRIVRIKLNAKHYIYQAHFPNQPITPGVIIIQIVTEVLSDIMSKKLNLKSVDNAKFISIIDPTIHNEISLRFTKITIENESSTCKAKIDIYSGENIFSRLSLTFLLKD